MKPEPRLYYVPAHVLLRWPALVEHAGADLAELAGAPGAIGFFPAYATADALIAAHGLVTYVAIRHLDIDDGEHDAQSKH